MTQRRLSIQEELQQRRPFRSKREEVFLALLRSAAVIRRPVSKVVEEHQLSLAQYNVLRILRGAGDAGLPTLAIRERMIEEAAGITRLIDKLEGAGLVVRDRGASADRRQVFCRITPAGLALLAAIDPQMPTSRCARRTGASGRVRRGRSARGTGARWQARPHARACRVRVRRRPRAGAVCAPRPTARAVARTLQLQRIVAESCVPARPKRPDAGGVTTIAVRAGSCPRNAPHRVACGGALASGRVRPCHAACGRHRHNPQEGT